MENKYYIGEMYYKNLIFNINKFLVLAVSGSKEESKLVDKKKSDDNSTKAVTKQFKNAKKLQEQTPLTNEQLTQKQQRSEIDLNRLLDGDFSTEGMSKDAQMQIEELTRQKDFEGLPQKEYNDQVSAIMNSEMN